MLVRARGVTVRVMRFVGPFRQSRLGLRAETGADGCGTIFEIPYGERYRKHRFYASLLILDSFVGAADGSANGTEHELSLIHIFSVDLFPDFSVRRDTDM